jgi:protein SCO1/2
MLTGLVRRTLFTSSKLKPRPSNPFHLTPLIRPFSDDPNKQLDPVTKKMREELNSKPPEEKTMPFLFYGTAALLTFLMFYVQYLLKSPQKQQKKPSVKILGNAKIGGSWSALNSEGKVVNDSEFLGNYLVFYFGFTRCPDVCPASLQKLSSAIDILKGKGIKNVKYLFISLDANRDTPEMVKKYAELFHPDIVPLVVREEDLTEFLKNFKLYSRKVLNENDYMLDHTTYMYLFDHQGKFVNILGANLSFDELAETIERHIKEDEN